MARMVAMVAAMMVAAMMVAAMAAAAMAAGGGKKTKVVVVNEGPVALCAKYWVPASGGGCRELRPGQAWELLSPASAPWEGATLWATRGGCASQACHAGPPSGVTQFQLTLAGFQARDYYDLSIAAGFNAGVAVRPTNAACPPLSCLAFSPHDPALCRAGATVTCPHGSSDYRVTFNAAAPP